DTDQQPRKARARVTPDAVIFFNIFAYTRHHLSFLLRHFGDDIHHVVDGDPAYQLTLHIHYRHRFKVISTHDLRHLPLFHRGLYAHDLIFVYIRHQGPGIGYDKFLNGHTAQQTVVVVDHVDRVEFCHALRLLSDLLDTLH